MEHQPDIKMRNLTSNMKQGPQCIVRWQSQIIIYILLNFVYENVSGRTINISVLQLQKEETRALDVVCTKTS